MHVGGVPLYGLMRAAQPPSSFLSGEATAAAEGADVGSGASPPGWTSSWSRCLWWGDSGVVGEVRGRTARWCVIEFDEPSVAPEFTAGGHLDAVVALPADSDDVSP